MAVLIGGIAATWYIADREFRDVLQDDLEQQAELLAELMADQVPDMNEDAVLDLLADAFEDDDEETVWVTVYDKRNDRILSNLPHELPLESDDDGRVVREFSGFGWHGVQDSEGEIVVQLLRRNDVYSGIQEELLEDIVTPAVSGGIMVLMLLALFVLMTLVPTTRLARELETRDAESLKPLVSGARVHEIRVLRDAINGLMSGIAVIIERERQFASDIAHELRTPLTTIRLELGADTPDLDVVAAETKRLIRLVEGLLVLARLEQRQWQSRFDQTDLAAVFEGVVERFREVFSHSELSLTASLESASVPGDAALLDTLLTNLLENILRHAAGASVASVTLRRLPDSVVLTVTDDGPGIEPDTLARMGDGFTRLDSRADGFGLGLAICHRIVAVHGGEIRFRQPFDGSSGLVVEVLFSA